VAQGRGAIQSRTFTVRRVAPALRIFTVAAAGGKGATELPPDEAAEFKFFKQLFTTLRVRGIHQHAINSTMSEAIHLRRLDATEWQTFRAVRLQALADAPHAFASTLAQWSGANDTPERWQQRVASVPLNLVALRGQEALGMCSVSHLQRDTEVTVMSMWVAPAARGQGVSDLLLAEVVQFATELGAKSLGLDVRASNAFALRLYARLGFVDVGAVEECDPAHPERRMRFTISA
jgi:ribosomal protein S18 acetylase RimI-like enzyme